MVGEDAQFEIASASSYAAVAETGGPGDLNKRKNRAPGGDFSTSFLRISTFTVRTDLLLLAYNTQ